GVSLNSTATLMITGVARPLMMVGSYSHWRTAATAALSSNGIDRTTRTSLTLPLAPMVVSRMTIPCSLADNAIEGYSGLTRVICFGGFTVPPTRTGPGGGAARRPGVASAGGGAAGTGC